MAKEFITERDIEDMVRRGILSLELNDNVVLTDLAYEKANRLGMRLVRDKPDNPPGAPVRPYLAQPRRRSAASPGAACPGGQPRWSPSARWRGAAPAHPQRGVARMGSQVDAKLLDVIIRRVLQSTGVR